jgi:colanic acid biosynthesis glycosyl transferase WcaI
MLAAANVGLVVQKFNVVSFNMPSKIQVLLASGCPILASVPEEGTAAMAIRSSGGGVLILPENAMALAAAVEDLYYQPEEVERLGQKGRQHAIAQYACQSAIDRYEELFCALTQREPCLPVGDEFLK